MSHYAQKDNLFPMQGGCPCGHVRYQLALPPLLVHCCHCTACQRQTGSAFAQNAIFESSALAVLPAAEPTIAGSPSNPTTAPAGVMPAFEKLMRSQGKENFKPAGTDLEMVFMPSGSGVGSVVMQCPQCHTGVWSYYADGGPHITYLRVGTLDLPWELQPDAHIYTRSRRDFIVLQDGKPQFEEYYADREALYRPDTKDRVERLKQKQTEWMAGFMAAMSRN
ncbi:glutathione-dependent formaldehyde-activating [Paramyrothecium foliicola]|nr:glutathione-dependent formaldehyde-activating [Paramyrothecium foliicola]